MVDKAINTAVVTSGAPLGGGGGRLRIGPIHPGDVTAVVPTSPEFCGMVRKAEEAARRRPLMEEVVRSSCRLCRVA